MIPSVFSISSLSRIFKAKTVKKTLLQTDDFLQSSDKKATCFTQAQINISGIFEKQRIKLKIFVNFLKKKHFLHIKTTIKCFWFHFAVLKECDIFQSNCIIFSKLFSASNQQLLCITESDIGHGPLNHTPPLYMNY